ncbi:YciI family protein [Varunaivibrio sulfuroxidans]|uniref:YCII-related domain-containing protein n=1 Tax=Varunaivibrio sulfuroxidans TaxID=1773489 RepID=A0A4R3JHN8_9PROT|nr:YciI family protein [Varunaivibrio sulfuroxidans]TCS64776.1 hypothetical protein EDD55_101105 [Varunaivibrio sulfuroxidans]WES29919.1 YciI family protein [Varunaivibrio sulfuroxidans]
MRYIVMAFDGADPDAPERRRQARPAHMSRAAKLHEDGVLLHGGAILDDAGAMIGSAVIFEVESRAALDTLIAEDPYATGDVWRNIDIRPFKQGF